MHMIDRILLYAASLAVAAVLVAGEPADREQASEPGVAAAQAAPIAASPAAPVNRLELVDRQGRPRLELLVDENDQPQLLMRTPAGEVALRLTCDAEGVSRLILGAGEAGRVAVTGTADGDQALELVGKEGAAARLVLTPEGSAELRLSGRDAGDELVLRQMTGEDAVIEMNSASHEGGISLRLQPTGVAALGLTAPDGHSGPVMHVFEDGLGEIAINGASSWSGPSLIRMPDGVSIVSTRLPSGDPGASMVTAPDGRSVIAATNSDASRQAELRVDDEGTPSIGVVDPQEQPDAIPQPAVPRQPQTVLLTP